MNSLSPEPSKAGAKSPESTTPSAVVFDLGKVLVDFDYGIASARIAAQADATPAEVRACLDHSPLLFRFETGRLSADGFFEEVRQSTGYRGTRADFESLFADIFSPIPSMIAAQQAVRARGVPTFIFSNTNELAVGHIRRSFPFFSAFEGYVLSFEHGSMKPESALYEVVERVTGQPGPRLLYFDDRPENVEAAARRGWQAVVHRHAHDSIATLRAAGLLG